MPEAHIWNSHALTNGRGALQLTLAPGERHYREWCPGCNHFPPVVYREEVRAGQMSKVLLLRNALQPLILRVMVQIWFR